MWQQIINSSSDLPMEKKFCKYYFNKSFNRSSRRKRGMASNPFFIIPEFFCISPMNFAMATLGLKEMGKFDQLAVN